MKIEKINDNKLKIALSKQDLIDKNIDIYSFNKLDFENQDLFLDLFEEAQLECDFDLNDSPLLIEGATNSNGGFILTITKMSKEKNNIIAMQQEKMPQVKVSRKYPNADGKTIIYSFDSFDNFVDFCYEVKKIPVKFENILFKYSGKYYLVFTNLYNDESLFRYVSSSLSDFGDYITYPNMFHYKLKEHGEMIIEKNAINTIKAYHINK